MQVGSTTKDGVAVIAPTGVIDTRTAMAFETELVQAFTAGTRSFAVDFTRVDLVTSAGIRVLVMMVHRLRGAGGIVLFGLTDRVRTVFEIGGLLQQFTFAATEQEALAHLSQQAPAATASKPPRPSRLATAVLDLVSHGTVLRAPVGSSAGTSVLATAVTETLARWSPDRSAESPPST